MAKIASLTIRLDPNLKSETERVLKDLGLTPSQAITLLYRQIALRRALPFEISLPNLETREAMDDIRNRRDLKTFDSADEALKSLGA